MAVTVSLNSLICHHTFFFFFFNSKISIKNKNKKTINDIKIRNLFNV